METIRIGNDVSVTWSIFSNGEEYELEGKDLKLTIKCCFVKKEIQDFTVKGNSIFFTFYGKEQSYSGIYSLVLVINDKKKGMYTVDAKNAFRLVSDICQSEVDNLIKTGICEVPITGEVYFQKTVFVDEQDNLRLNLTTGVDSEENNSLRLCINGKIYGKEYKIRLLRRLKRNGGSERNGWRPIYPQITGGVGKNNCYWFVKNTDGELCSFTHDVRFIDFEWDGNTMNDLPLQKDGVIVTPFDIAQQFFKYKDDGGMIHVRSGYSSKRIIGQSTTTVIQLNYGLAIYRYEDGKPVDIVSNIAPFGITIKGYCEGHDFYGIVRWNLSENYSRINPRYLLEFI